MTRSTIAIPETLLFSTEYQVVYTDINNANHLGSDRVLPIALEAQFRFMQHVGFDEMNNFSKLGLIMAHSETSYLAQANHGDRLLIEVGVDNFQRSSFRFVYRFNNQSTGKEMARVTTTMLFFDYTENCVVPVPETFREQCQS